MKIVDPYARLMAPIVFGISEHASDYLAHSVFCLEHGIRMLRQIEWCGRISHRSEEAQTGDSYERFIRAIVLDHGDWSIVEHASVSVDMLVDRGITHEIVRPLTKTAHRQETKAKGQYASGVRSGRRLHPERFHAPLGDRNASRLYPQLRRGTKNDRSKLADVDVYAIRALYKLGDSQMSLARRYSVSGLVVWRIVNDKGWSHLFEDIEPMARQAENMRKGR